MNSIVYVGMDVHKESYTVCCYCFDTDEIMYKQKLPSDYRMIRKYMEQVSGAEAKKAGNTEQVIAYVDKANERLRRRFYKMTLNKRLNRNVAITAIARELVCVMWGQMTDHIA